MWCFFVVVVLEIKGIITLDAKMGPRHHLDFARRSDVYKATQLVIEEQL